MSNVTLMLANLRRGRRFGLLIVVVLALVAGSGLGSNDRVQASSPPQGQPYFKVYGGSVLAGGEFASINGQCTGGGEIAGWNNDTVNGDTQNVGSGSQLNAIALQQITGFATAQDASSDRAPTALTFANSGVPPITYDGQQPLLGGLFDPTGSHCLTEVPQPAATQSLSDPTSWQSNLTCASESGQVGQPGVVSDVGCLNSGAYNYTGNVSLNLAPVIVNATNISQTPIAIFVHGDVYITGCANETSGSPCGGYNSYGGPDFILEATGNIYINNATNVLDGLFIAKHKVAGDNYGRIYDCATAVDVPVPAASLYSQCNTPLEVLGTFVADQVNLMRTYGTLSSAEVGEGLIGGSAMCNDIIDNSCAAENFEMSPELWISNPLLTAPGPPPYDAITSLPPVL